VHPAGVEPATSGLGNHCPASNLAEFGHFFFDAVPVSPKDREAFEPKTVQGVRGSNGLMRRDL
jgi:hypothetical protein